MAPAEPVPCQWRNSAAGATYRKTNVVTARIFKPVDRILVRAGCAVAEFPEPRCDFAGRSIRKLDAQWRDAAGFLRCEACRRRQRLRPRNRNDAVGAARAAGAADAQRNVVCTFFGEDMPRIALVTGCAVAEVPAVIIDLAGRSVCKLHGER